MAETKAQATLSLERRMFLEEMGAIVASGFDGFEVQPNGVVEGTYGRWVPLEEQEPLDPLFKTMRLVGLDPAEFKFQQYEVWAANPYHGFRIDLKFPPQLVIKGQYYAAIHAVDLVLKSPFVAATEIQTGVRRHQRG